MNPIKLVAVATALFAALSTATFAQDVGAPALNARALNRVEHRLNITPQQREQARDILQQERPALQQMRLSLVAERKEMAATSSNGVFDPVAAHAVAMKYAEVNANAAVERTKVRTQLLAILTPEQMAKLQQLRARIAALLGAEAQGLGDTL